MRSSAPPSPPRHQLTHPLLSLSAAAETRTSKQLVKPEPPHRPSTRMERRSTPISQVSWGCTSPRVWLAGWRWRGRRGPLAGVWREADLSCAATQSSCRSLRGTWAETAHRRSSFRRSLWSTTPIPASSRSVSPAVPRSCVPAWLPLLRPQLTRIPAGHDRDQVPPWSLHQLRSHVAQASRLPRAPEESWRQVHGEGYRAGRGASRRCGGVEWDGGNGGLGRQAGSMGWVRPCGAQDCRQGVRGARGGEEEVEGGGDRQGECERRCRCGQEGGQGWQGEQEEEEEGGGGR